MATSFPRTNRRSFLFLAACALCKETYARQPSAAAPITASPCNWRESFARSVERSADAKSSAVLAEVRSNGEGYNLNVLAFSLEASPRMLITLYAGSADAFKSELWLTDTAGTNACRLAQETGRSLGCAVWSPTGRFIAYIASPMGMPEQTPTQLVVIDVPSAKKKVVAEGEFDSLRWSAKEESLLCLQRSPDYWWHPLCFDAAADTLIPTGAIRCPSLGAFSPDGSRFAVLDDKGDEKLSVYDIHSGTRKGIVLSQTIARAMGVTHAEISGDGSLLYLQGRIIMRDASMSLSYLIHLDSGSVSSLNAKLSDRQSGGTEAQEEIGAIEVTSAAWVPGTDQKLFVHAAPARDPRGSGIRSRSSGDKRQQAAFWFVYSPDIETLQQIRGLAPPTPLAWLGNQTIKMSNGADYFLVDLWSLYRRNKSLQELQIKKP